MVNVSLWGRSKEELLPKIESQHQKVWSDNKFYLHYPVLQRWKLKTKEQHFKSIRCEKNDNFVCKYVLNN